jgi:hypothetical protein
MNLMDCYRGGSTELYSGITIERALQPPKASKNITPHVNSRTGQGRVGVSAPSLTKFLSSSECPPTDILNRKLLLRCSWLCRPVHVRHHTTALSSCKPGYVRNKEEVQQQGKTHNARQLNYQALTAKNTMKPRATNFTTSRQVHVSVAAICTW